MPSTYTYKKFKDKNGNIAYHKVNYVKFENKESVDPETFKGKYFTKVAVGKHKDIYSKKTFDEEGNYIEPTQEVTVFDSFEYRKSFAYSKVKKTKEYWLIGYIESSNGDYSFYERRADWGLRESIREKKDNTVYKKISRSKPVEKTIDAWNGFWYLVGVAIFAYLLISMMTGLGFDW